MTRHPASLLRKGDSSTTSSLPKEVANVIDIDTLLYTSEVEESIAANAVKAEDDYQTIIGLFEEVIKQAEELDKDTKTTMPEAASST